jgi:hypothetical protein
LSKPLKIQIVERARALIADEEHWCRRHFAEDANGFPVSATSASAIKWCGLGAVIAAAYQLTHNTDAAYQVGYQILRPRYGSATLIHTNDEKGHAAACVVRRSYRRGLNSRASACLCSQLPTLSGKVSKANLRSSSASVTPLAVF